MDTVEYLYFEGKNEAAMSKYTKITPRTFAMFNFHALAFRNVLATNAFFLLR